MRDKLFNNLKEIQQEMLKIVSEVSTLTQYPMTLDQNNIDSHWVPHCDMFSIADKLYIILEIANINHNELRYSINENFIKVNGKRNCEYQYKNVSFYNMEIESGDFERKIYFPDLNIDIHHPEIKYEEGFLKFVFPIKEDKVQVIHIQID
ncbi:MAG TPA: Hsp20 family protein [Candidatus Cloacimonadota bacterium]|nr:Hsp20 family protein [Candidatus Cloacimonadota bacterium]